MRQERARILAEEREEAERTRREEMEEERRDDMRLGAAAMREPALNISIASTASTLILNNENFVMDEVSLLPYTF